MSNILSIAIVLVCFYDALLLAFIPSSATFFLAGDGMASEMVTYLMAIAIGLYSCTFKPFKVLPNKWLAGLLLFIVFSSFHSPNVQFSSAFTPKDPGLFNFKPMLESVLYFILICGVLSLSFSYRRLGKTIGVTAIVYGIYIISQHIGMDQFYKLQDNTYNQLSRNPQDGGFISQPVYAAAMLAICLPFCVKYFKFWSLLPLIAALLTTNRSCLSAIAISSVYFFTNNKTYLLLALGAYIAIIAIVMGIFVVHPAVVSHIDDYGRLTVWKNVILDMIHPIFPGIHKSYVLTGLGIGSFSVFFPFYHQSPFFQAHNEYLEVLYCLGPIGLFLLVKAMWHVFKTTTDKTIMTSLIAISVFAITNPVWHIPQLQFMTALLIGWVYNKEISYELGSATK